MNFDIESTPWRLEINSLHRVTNYSVRATRTYGDRRYPFVWHNTGFVWPAVHVRMDTPGHIVVRRMYNRSAP